MPSPSPSELPAWGAPLITIWAPSPWRENIIFILLVVLRRPYVVLGIEPSLAACEAATTYCTYLPWTIYFLPCQLPWVSAITWSWPQYSPLDSENVFPLEQQSFFVVVIDDLSKEINQCTFRLWWSPIMAVGLGRALLAIGHAPITNNCLKYKKESWKILGRGQGKEWNRVCRPLGKGDLKHQQDAAHSASISICPPTLSLSNPEAIYLWRLAVELQASSSSWLSRLNPWGRFQGMCRNKGNDASTSLSGHFFSLSPGLLGWHSWSLQLLTSGAACS